MDTEGLRVLKWSMFDSPDTPGSGYRFMEREPVIALDRACHRYEYKPNVILGYTSKMYADKLGLVSTDSHRVGQAVRLRCVGSRKRINYIRALSEQGVMRFAIAKEYIYFDTDPLKKPAIYLWD